MHDLMHPLVRQIEHDSELLKRVAALIAQTNLTFAIGLGDMLLGDWFDGRWNAVVGFVKQMLVSTLRSGKAVG